jgi:hypothetical protein
MKSITYPARPLNGGRFGLVTKKPIHLWSMKVNGWRALIHTPTGTMFNRQGEELTIAGEFAEALEDLSRSSIEWLDCEALERRHNVGRGSLIILDAVVPDLIASERYQLLIRDSLDSNTWPFLFIEDRPEENKVYVMKQTAMSEASHTGKLVLTDWWGWMQLVNKQWGTDFYEGFVAKRADSVYPIQLRSPDSDCPFWIKHRWAW